MGVLVGALGALGAMLVPGAVGHGVETHSVFVATAVIVVVLILAYVTNPSAASFRTFLTELAFRRHLSKLHDASEADPPALTWARHSHQIDAAPHLQFATRASVSVRSSAHIFRSFGVLTIAAVTPVADHRNKRNQANSFASDQGRWFLGAFGKWWLGGALLLGKADDGHSTAGLLDIRLLDDSELSKWTVVPEPTGRRTPPPLPKHASLPLHTQAKQPTQKPSKSKAKSKPAKTSATEPIPPTSSPANASNTTNIDAHPILADLLQHIATTQTTLSNARAQLAQLHASTAHTREQTEDHIAQRTKHNSASSTSEAAKTHTHQLTNARRTLRASQKTLASVQATHAALEQRANTLIEEAKALQEKVIRDGEKAKEGEEKGEVKRGELADAIVARKEELRSLEEEVMGSSGEDKEVVGLVGKVRALEAEVKEARKTLDELKAWQASLGEQLTPEDLESRGPEQEQEKEKEPGVVYIGQTPVRAVALNNSSQVTPQRIQGVTVSHARIISSPGTVMAHSTPVHPVNQHVMSPTTITAPTPATPVTDAASPARSARSKGYAIFDTDLAGLGGPKPAGLSAKKPALAAPIGKGLVKVPGLGATGASVTAPIVKDHLGTNVAPIRPTFAPFDSDTPPIPIPKRTNSGYALNPDGTKYSPVAPTKFGDGLSFGLAMDSPTSGTFSPPLTALLPSSLFSEDGHRWDGEAASPGPFANGSSPAQLINESGSSPSQFGNAQWTNGTSPGNYRNGTSPARWEKDADGWVNEAKPATSSWGDKALGNGFIPSKDGRDGWIGDSDAWTGEGLRRWESPAGNGVWPPRTEGRPRSVSVESRFEVPAGRPRSDSYEAHRLSSGADSGYHTATNPSTAPKKRNSGSSSGEDAAQDVPANGLSFSPPFLQHSPVSGSIDAPASSFGSGIFGPPNQLSTRRGYDAQRVSLPARVPLIREVEESDPTAASESAPSTSPSKSRRWFPGVGSAKKEPETSVRVQKSELNPDAKVFSFSPDSKIFNFTRGRTFSLTPPASADPPASTFVPFGLGASANSSTPALGNGSVSSASSGTFFSSLLAFAPSPAEREALQRALGTNGITRTLSNTSARSPFTSPLPSARSSAVDLSDKAALAWNESTPTPVVQKRTWFPVRKKAAVEESE